MLKNVTIGGGCQLLGMYTVSGVIFAINSLKKNCINVKAHSDTILGMQRFTGMALAALVGTILKNKS